MRGIWRNWALHPSAIVPVRNPFVTPRDTDIVFAHKLRELEIPFIRQHYSSPSGAKYARVPKRLFDGTAVPSPHPARASPFAKPEVVKTVEPPDLSRRKNRASGRRHALPARQASG
jgi:hypothetical protein